MHQRPSDYLEPVRGPWANITIDTSAQEDIKKYYPEGLPDNHGGRNRALDKNWPTDVPLFAFNSKAEMDAIFYSGVKGRVKDVERVFHDRDHRSSRPTAGVIGEERERHGLHRVNKQQDIIHERASALEDEGEEAGAKEDEGHDPLLRLTLASLNSYLVDGGRKVPSSFRFDKAEDAWIDNTEEGARSFFDTSKAEQPRKKKVLKKTRRGY